MVHRTRLAFGFEGIYQGTAVLYDRQTKSLWLHLTGEAIAGPLEGTVLERIETGRHTTWADWRATHPETDVMRPDPDYRRLYFPREEAHAGSEMLPFMFPPTIQTRSSRLGLSDLLYGVLVEGRARAYPFAGLAERPVVEETLAGVPITVWYDAASGSAAAFDRRLEGRTLAFVVARGARRRDRETRSVWTMDGEAVGGPLAGRRLTPVHGLLTEWYGWYANRPQTSVWQPR